MHLDQNQIFAKRYMLKKLIGVGGYSQVWLASDIKSGNLDIALKIFAPGQGLDDKGLELFSKEFSLVFNLSHPGLLKPTYFDDFEGSPYLVMQYCQQGSVFGKIGEMSEKALARFMQQAASALAYLHGQNPPIIHQDIKPDNFLIDNQGNYLLADFGISSKIRRTLTKSIGAHASTGTMAYMPPEKFSADKQIIKAGDIFSLGVTMYELLTGDLPFGENGGLTLKAGADVPNLSGNFSPDLNLLLLSCMAKDPWERPPADKLVEVAGGFLKNGQWSQVETKTPESGPPKVPDPASGGRRTQPILQFESEPGSASDRPEVFEIVRIKPIIQKSRKLWIIAILILIITSITVVDQFNKNGSVLDFFKSKKIWYGDSYAGGIVFELDETRKHGKVCAFFDQSTGASWEEAKVWSEQYSSGGYTDWRLPSKVDFIAMLILHNKERLGGFDSTSYYWSSSIEGGRVFALNFNSQGSVSAFDSKTKLYVRLIRDF